MTDANSHGLAFHLSLNVSNVNDAVAYLERLLGQPAAKCRPDYAKFEIGSPPLVLSLEPRSPAQHGSLNHLGFRLPDSASLVDVQRRLEQAGIATQREEGVECCYARQTKFWVHDADQRLWEFYVHEGDLEHRGIGQVPDQLPVINSSSPQRPQVEKIATDAPRVWEHLMGSPMEVPKEPCDEIRLRGSFNLPTSATDLQNFLSACHAGLRPGGKLFIHVLTAEEPIRGELRLPGPAAYVRHVPVRQQLMSAVEAAGFVDLQLAKFGSTACFEHDGQPLRETQMVAYRPAASESGECAIVLKGPFRELVDDLGITWRRGEATRIPRARWKAMQQMPTADFFVELPLTPSVSSCGTAASPQ